MTDSMFDLTKLSKHYSQTYNKYGFNSKGADWGDLEKHHLRISSMIDLLGTKAFENRHILDVGCGYGSLYSALKIQYPNNNLKYFGIDPCVDVIDFAKANTDSGAQFLCSDIQSFSSLTNFDTVFCCGIFTKKANMTNNEMYELLHRFFLLMKNVNASSVCFNTMSPFCDRRDNEIFYPKFEKIMGMIATFFGYNVFDFMLSNSHLRYEMIWKFDLNK